MVSYATRRKGRTKPHNGTGTCRTLAYTVLLASATRTGCSQCSPGRSETNGRTSRLLSTLVLYQAGYDFKRLFAISEIYDRDRAAFYSVLQQVREAGVTSPTAGSSTSSAAWQPSSSKSKSAAQRPSRPNNSVEPTISTPAKSRSSTNSWPAGKPASMI